jgi:hypothetical protein
MSIGTSDNRRWREGRATRDPQPTCIRCRTALVYCDHLPGNVVNLLVRVTIRGDFHDVRLVLSQPRIDAQGVCL